MNEPTQQESGKIHIDLSKYMKAPTEKSSGGKAHRHYLEFRDDRSPDEKRAYEIIHYLHKRKGMTMRQIGDLFYEYVLIPFAEEEGI